MRKTFRMKTVVLAMIVILLSFCASVDAYACSLFYAGGDMTDDGANMFVRAEEIGADDNKIYSVSPMGKHAKDEVYQGCTDFTWTFTHDSYRYTARCDGMPSGICADCGQSHDHTPYEEAGTNDHGVTVSATESLNANTGIQSIDPFIEGGIDESVMATVLLSEASTAREGVELLARIYDSVGADYEGSGVMICDQNEQWYMENLSGHEYIAVLLPADVAFMQFNVSVLGRIDLDDTDHVIASDHLIDTAKRAGTFVGEEEENIIDFRASYNDYLMEIENEDWSAEWKSLVQARLATALNDLEGSDAWDVDDVLENNAFVMTNVDEDGNITALHNQLKLKDKMTLENVISLFRMFPIGFEENVNTHLYRFYKEEEQALGTEEWFAMDNCMYSIFVPSYPMLLTDTWEGYKVQLDETILSDEKPEKEDYYLKDGEYHIHPDGWDESYIGTFSALSNLLLYGDLSEKEINLAEKNIQDLQEEFVKRFRVLSEEIRDTGSVEAREEMMTKADMEMAEQAHDLALALYRYFVYGENSGLIRETEDQSSMS